jgi:hypothetical protein
MPSRQDVGDQVLVGGNEEGEDVRARDAAGVTADCQGIVALPDTARELDIATKYNACTHVYTRIDDRVLAIKPAPEMKYRGGLTYV